MPKLVGKKEKVVEIDCAAPVQVIKGVLAAKMIGKKEEIIEIDHAGVVSRAQALLQTPLLTPQQAVQKIRASN